MFCVFYNFYLKIASYGGQNVHQFVAENQLDMGEWIVCIQATIHKLVRISFLCVFVFQF